MLNTTFTIVNTIAVYTTGMRSSMINIFLSRSA